MKVVFMGTPMFALPTLEALHQAPFIDLVAVVTQPDRINKRGNKSVYSPIKLFAMENELRLFQPEDLYDESFSQFLNEERVDIIVVVAYGKILPRAILDLPKYGCLNIHASLLPKYRGAAPIQHALLEGCSHTGISIMKLDAGMDTGDVLLMKPYSISDDMDSLELTKELAKLGASSLIEVLKDITQYLANATPQCHREATYANKIEKTMGKIDWRKSPVQIHRLVNALHGNPGVYTFFRGKRIKIHRTGYSEMDDGESGVIIAVESNYIKVGTGGLGAVLIYTLQPENKPIMEVRDWIHGHQVKVGERFG